MPFSVAIARTSGDDETRDRVFRALGEIPEEEREVVLLRHLDGLDRATCAERLEIPLDEFDRRARSARERLRSVLAGSTGGPP